jgi:hypothetical protein
MQEAGSVHRGSLGRLLPCLVVVVLTLTQTGCLVVAAGAAAGAAATGYVYYKGRACRDFPASLADAHAATRAALLDLQFPVVTEESKNDSSYIASRTADGSTIRIWLELEPSRVPADGTLTRVSVRVGAFGDESVSRRILDQVAVHFVAPGLVRQQAAAASPPAPAPIQPVRAVVPGETAPPPLAPPAPGK